MTDRRSYSHRSLQEIYRSGMSQLELALRLEEVGYSVGGFVRIDDNGRHAFLQRYAGVVNREGRIRTDAPALPDGALILCQHPFINEPHVIDHRTGAITGYREPPERIGADPHARLKPSELAPRDTRWDAH